MSGYSTHKKHIASVSDWLLIANEMRSHKDYVALKKRP